MYKIEKGIPVPRDKNYKKKYNFPFSEMEIGDSFRIEALDKRNALSIKAQAFNRVRKLGCKLETRFEYEGDKIYVRVWLVEKL